ncbi:hypothetical protein GIS00_26235 [Nakamurella sp. YIM 132087]|uniref:DedA family protein n=1 Tax=Nakamurella alba TaxID=2665158 RepID=A0A7K1FTF2_9ACTN|nr:hypothetical protein [Nakamurella alba]MTD17436.1 hypothetical protein [Nakamurella alba]
MLTDLLAGLPTSPVVLVVVALLVAEAALLVGVLLPGSSAVLLLGAAGSGSGVPAPVLAVIAALASVTGGLVAGRLGRRSPLPPRLLVHVPPRWVGGRPAGALIASAQALGGARTVLPRIWAAGGLSPARWLMIAGPAALAWAGLWTWLGASAVAVPAALEPALLGGGLLVVVALVLRRRAAGRRHAASPAPTPEAVPIG